MLCSSCEDAARLEPLLAFFTHQLEKGFVYDTYQYGRSRGAIEING